MTIVVNDANILIDLIKLDLLQPFFQMGWTFHSTNLIIENELYDEQKQALKPFIENGKLKIEELDIEDMMAIIEIQTEKPQLSDKDCSALHCARKLQAALITSDNALRKYAKVQLVEVHGHLWVFDAMVAEGCLSPVVAVEKLIELNTVNSKLSLPAKECQERIARWKSME